MADRTEALVLQMSADIRKMERALNQARGTTNRSLSAVEKRFDQMNAHVRRSGDDMARDLRTSIASIGVGLAIREVTQYADVWTTAQNRLAAAGVAQDQLAGTMSDLVSLARETRSEFGGTVELYAKLTRAGQQLNLTQTEVRKITETTLQAFVAGGAAASEQAAAVTQLSQALGSGVLQGDELRSIRENAPLLAEAIAKEFNTTIAGLKELGAEGQLTADRVATAILNADGIFQSFERTVSTVEQAMTNLRTEFTRYIAESRVAQTVVQALGGFIQLVTDNIDLFADAAIVAAAVIGGTLAVAAIGRLVASLKTMVTSVRSAETAMKGLQLAMTFLGGPLGAIVLGIGAALFTMATNTSEAASAADDAAAAFANVDKILADITNTQGELERAQQALTKAIREGGEAARVASALEVDRLRKNLQGNKALLDVEKAKAAIAVRERAREFETKLIPAPFLSEEQNQRIFGDDGGVTMQGLTQRFALPRLTQRGQTGDEFLAEMAIKAQTQALTDQEAALLKVVSAGVAYDAEMKTLRENLKAINEIKLDVDLDPGDILEFPGTDGDGQRGSGQASTTRGFRTEAEALTDALKELRAARDADTQSFSEMVTARDSYQEYGRAIDDLQEYESKLQEMDDQIEEVLDKQGEAAGGRSRQAVQALLDFAGNGQLAEAFGQIPSIRDLLIGDDEALLLAELDTLAKASVDAVATGVDALGVEFEQKFKEIEAAQQAAIAAGIFDSSSFERMYGELFDWLDEQLTERTEVPFPYDMDALSEEMKGFIGDIEWEVAGEELRQVMRDSVKNALREGIRTGDWGDAFAMILADAVTTGLDDALNRIGDWLADFLFAENGFLTNLASSASNWASSAIFGQRAGGGAAMAGRGYRVNDRGGDGEFLFMGSNPGQVLRSSDLAGMLGGSRGQSVSIHAPLTIMGSVDAVTWPKVQAAMQQQARQIMTAVPATVNATLIDNRIQKRRL